MSKTSRRRNLVVSALNGITDAYQTISRFGRRPRSSVASSASSAPSAVSTPSSEGGHSPFWTSVAKKNLEEAEICLRRVEDMTGRLVASMGESKNLDALADLAGVTSLDKLGKQHRRLLDLLHHYEGRVFKTPDPDLDSKLMERIMRLAVLCRQLREDAQHSTMTISPPERASDDNWSLYERFEAVAEVSVTYRGSKPNSKSSDDLIDELLSRPPDQDSTFEESKVHDASQHVHRSSPALTKLWTVGSAVRRGGAVPVQYS